MRFGEINYRRYVESERLGEGGRSYGTCGILQRRVDTSLKVWCTHSCRTHKHVLLKTFYPPLFFMLLLSDTVDIAS